VTVLEGIQKSAEFLAKKNVESPRLQAELLLADVLKLPRMRLYLSFDRNLDPTEVELLREKVRRRGTREPLQHIVGSTSFCGLEIVVNRHVLVPRPETELLAEAGWEFLATVPHESPSVLDFGTGSGCLAVSLAAKHSGARVCAVDVSPEALAVARENATRNQVADRIDFIESDGLAGLPENLRFDLVISNPPYIPTSEIESLEPEVREFDPRGALDGGEDGCRFYRLLAEKISRWLNAGGCLMVELGDNQAEAVRKIFEEQKWIVEAVKPDYTQRPRTLIARR
jgi:release factor glutamine methyltransferase